MVKWGLEGLILLCLFNKFKFSSWLKEVVEARLVVRERVEVEVTLREVEEVEGKAERERRVDDGRKIGLERSNWFCKPKAVKVDLNAIFVERERMNGGEWEEKVGSFEIKWFFPPIVVDNLVTSCSLGVLWNEVSIREMKTKKF